jgi:acyl carrier protein
MPSIEETIGSVLQIDPTLLKEDDTSESVAGWDSLRMLMLASAIEINYGFTLRNDEIEKLTSVANVRQIVAKHVSI